MPTHKHIKVWVLYFLPKKQIHLRCPPAHLKGFLSHEQRPVSKECLFGAVCRRTSLAHTQPEFQNSGVPSGSQASPSIHVGPQFCSGGWTGANPCSQISEYGCYHSGVVMEWDLVQPRQCYVQMSKDLAVLFIHMTHFCTSESTALPGWSESFQSTNWLKEQQQVKTTS